MTIPLPMTLDYQKYTLPHQLQADCYESIFDNGQLVYHSRLTGYNPLENEHYLV